MQSLTNEQRLAMWLNQTGFSLPSPAEPKGLYRPVVVCNNLAYTSGHLPVDASGQMIKGTVGQDLTEEQGRQAAVWAGLGILSSLRATLGNLNAVRRVIKITGLVQSAPGFHGQPAVLNGCSQLFAEVFGPENGVGVRTAFGTPTLPLGAAVEIEAIFELGTE
ncbi:MAG: RidA family protein [Thermogutta sp.]|nr:RidA family protein [Thermogutta sp.]HQF12901.1 RidA family protein [Thermogutta sp.]